jgi:hypothetical protein
MASFFTRPDVVSLSNALANALNALHDQKFLSDGYFHRDKTSSQSVTDGSASTLLTVTAANATNLATSLTLTNQLKGVFGAHCKDDSSHLIKDLVNSMDGYADATNLATVQVVLNALKVKYNAHLSQSGVHVVNDPNTVATANATDQSTANALANALKAALNIHLASGPGVGRVVVLK